MYDRDRDTMAMMIYTLSLYLIVDRSKTKTWDTATSLHAPFAVPAHKRKIVPPGGSPPPHLPRKMPASIDRPRKNQHHNRQYTILRFSTFIMYIVDISSEGSSNRLTRPRRNSLAELPATMRSQNRTLVRRDGSRLPFRSPQSLAHARKDN